MNPGAVFMSRISSYHTPITPWNCKRSRRWPVAGRTRSLLERYQAAGNSKAVERLRRMSPVAWRHIHFLGHYLFKDQQHPIDLAALLAGVELV
jgi:Tn3 transposase DDE domain